MRLYRTVNLLVLRLQRLYQSSTFFSKLKEVGYVAIIELPVVSTPGSEERSIHDNQKEAA